MLRTLLLRQSIAIKLIRHATQFLTFFFHYFLYFNLFLLYFTFLYFSCKFCYINSVTLIDCHSKRKIFGRFYKFSKSVTSIVLQIISFYFNVKQEFLIYDFSLLTSSNKFKQWKDSGALILRIEKIFRNVHDTTTIHVLNSLLKTRRFNRFDRLSRFYRDS